MTSKAKKIAIIGTHFVGKTTVCENLFDYLSREGHNVGMLTEVVRDCPYPVNEMATVKAQDWILNQQKKMEIELGEKHDIILMDRGVIDNFAYWKRVAEKVNLSEKIIEEKEKEVFEHSESYNMIIFLQPFMGRIADDKFRSIDPVWRDEMHDRISEIVEKFKVNYDAPIFVVNGSKKDVTERVKDLIANIF
ncbi:MAG: AAA family ATPase [Candidatus Aenigmarchaeota archaeon]|nr:AAA family ATPase [Candidatus Aenigmarchaeota archaeon]